MSIANATTQCLQIMTACLEIEKLMKAAWAENRLADFKLWIAGTGALARSKLSLDTRLNIKPEAREVITNLLNLLAIAVEECQKIATREATGPFLEADDEEDLSELLGALSGSEIPARPFSPWSDDDSASDEQSLEDFEQLLPIDKSLHKSMQDIEMMLDQLAQIAIAVRRSGTRSRLHRADQQFKPEEHRDLQAHLTTIILLNMERDHSKLITSEEEFDSSNLSDIQRRLIRCNLKRRNRFLYAQRHSKSLGLVTAPTAAPKRPPEAATTVKTAQTAQTSDSQKGVKTGSQRSSSSAPGAAGNEAKAQTNPTITTGTKASTVSDSFVLPQPALPSPGASTVLSSTVVSLKYPRPPRITDGAHTFACPCCCQTFPRDFSEGNRWKKHIASDLNPYTCILSGCANPEVLYTTKNDWRQHLLDKHLGFEYWICFTCEGSEQFRSEGEFIHHNKLDHESSINPGEMSLLADICRRVAPVEVSSCPLCDWPKDEEGEVDKNMLLDHIAKDLHSFSLRSLPWDDDNGQESEERVDHSSEKVSKWLIDNELQKTPSIERPPLEKKVHTFSYFRHNLYFAASSASSNSSEHDSTTSLEKELKNLKEIEGSVTFGSRAGGEVDEGDELPFTADDSKDETPLNLNIGDPKKKRILEYLLGQEMANLTVMLGQDAIELLLGQPDDQITITKEVVKALAKNDVNAQEVMTLFLDVNRQTIFTDEAVASVAEEFDEKVMALLLDRPKGQIIITDEILEAAARNKLRSKEVTAFLLERREESNQTSTKNLRFLDGLDINTLPSRYKKIGSDWSAVFNPNVKRVVDIDLVRSLDHDATVFSVQFSYDGQYVATGIDGSAQIFDVHTGEKVCVLVHDDREGFKDDNIIHGIRFSPDGRCLATAENEYVRIWDIATKTILHQFSGGKGYVNSLDFSRDGRIVAFDGDDTVHICDVIQNRNASVLRPESSVRAVAISPDTRRVAAGSLNGSIYVWDIATLSLIATLEGPDGHEGPIRSVSFLRNSRSLISGGFDETVKMWDLDLPNSGVDSGGELSRCIKTIGGQDFAVTRDNYFVLSSSRGPSVQFWGVADGVPELMLRGHSREIYSVASSPQLDYFVTGSGDKKARIWSYGPYMGETETPSLDNTWSLE